MRRIFTVLFVNFSLLFLSVSPAIAKSKNPLDRFIIGGFTGGMLIVLIYGVRAIYRLFKKKESSRAIGESNETRYSPDAAYYKEREFENPAGETFTTSEGKSYDESQPPPHEPPPGSEKEQYTTTDDKGQGDFQSPPGQPPDQSRPHATESIYAGFWNRFAALFIDSLIIAAGSAMFSLPFLIAKGLRKTTSYPSLVDFDFILSLLTMLIGWLYCTLLESSTKRATIGKMAVGIIVTDINGNRVSFGRANGRWWGKTISFLILGIGCIMAGFTRKKQALHDIMADTLVLARPEGIRTWLTATIIGGMGVIFLITISYIILNRQPTRTIDDTQTASVPSSSISKEQPTSTQPPSETDIQKAVDELNRRYGLGQAELEPKLPQPQPQFQSPPQAPYQKEAFIPASEYNNRGVECLEKGEYNEAIKNFTTAISKDKRFYSAYINRGRVYYETKQYQAAINDFKDASTLAPDDIAPYNWCGVVYYKMEIYYEATRYFTEAISKAPQNPTMYLNRGYTYVKMGITYRSYAISDFKKACELGDRNACNMLKDIQ